MNENTTVYVVDDDQAVRETITHLVDDMGMKFQAFSSAERFLASYNYTGPNCLVLDVRMPGMSGMELLTKLSDENMRIPTVLITGHGDIPMAVEALKAGAVSFVEKPFREHVLWEKIKEALEISNNSRHIYLEHDKLVEKISLLTDKERQILKGLLASETDKQIAIKMGFTRRTAAHHRINILEKMEAVSLIELAQSVTKFEISI